MTGRLVSSQTRHASCPCAFQWTLLGRSVDRNMVAMRNASMATQRALTCTWAFRVNPV